MERTRGENAPLSLPPALWRWEPRRGYWRKETVGEELRAHLQALVAGTMSKCVRVRELLTGGRCDGQDGPGRDGGSWRKARSRDVPGSPTLRRDGMMLQGGTVRPGRI